LRVSTTPAISTLSLHDALPISHDVLVLVRVDLVGRGVEALETGAPGEHVVLPALMRGLAPVELGHDLAREELEAGTDVLVWRARSEEHTSELQSPDHLVCRLLL